MLLVILTDGGRQALPQDALRLRQVWQLPVGAPEGQVELGKRNRCERLLQIGDGFAKAILIEQRISSVVSS